MNYYKRRGLAFILSAVMTFSLMTACAPTDTSESSSVENSTDTTSVESSSAGGSETTTGDEGSETTTGNAGTEPGGSVNETEETSSVDEPAPIGSDLSAGELDSANYEDYSAEALNWWYRRTTDLGTEFRDTVDLGIKKMIDPFQAVYQDPSEAKDLYLTFDAGYENKANTAAILDILLEHNVKAAFFITGAYMDSSPDVVKRMLNEGHLVANHTLEHKNPVETLAQEGILAMARDIEANAEKFEQLTSVSMPKYIRPGQGVYSEQVLAIYADMGYRTVFWDFAYRDWLVDDQPDPEASLNQLIGELHPGSVILLHAVSDTNVAILGDFLTDAITQGYSFSSLTEYP